jgi:hypothetical protein
MGPFMSVDIVIWVRIGAPHPLASLMRRLDRAVFQIRQCQKKNTEVAKKKSEVAK